MNKSELTIIKEVHKFVKDASVGFSEDDVFTNHVLAVTNYSQQLAKKYSADIFVVTIAAYLHDIYHLQTHNHEIHEVEGAKFANKYLRKFDISEDRIKLICACILNHRGSKQRKRKTVEEKILACADAMDHINRWKHMFYRSSRKRTYDETLKWMNDKLERGWNKLELPEAKKIIKEKYQVAKAALKNT